MDHDVPKLANPLGASNCSIAVATTGSRTENIVSDILLAYQAMKTQPDQTNGGGSCPILADDVTSKPTMSQQTKADNVKSKTDSVSQSAEPASSPLPQLAGDHSSPFRVVHPRVTPFHQHDNLPVHKSIDLASPMHRRQSVEVPTSSRGSADNHLSASNLLAQRQTTPTSSKSSGKNRLSQPHQPPQSSPNPNAKPTRRGK